MKPVLVPPEPNLGPEPWPTAGWSWDPFAAIAAMAVAVAALAWIVRRRRIRSRPSAPATTPGPLTSQDVLRERVEAIRRSLADRFGPTWLAKTTEEIAAESALSDRLGPERAAELIRFLQAADRARFAADRGGDDYLLGDSPYASILASLAAGATSKIKGR